MKSYYEHGGITIYHGDCREVLPSLAFDLAVCDPQYGMEYRSNYRIVKLDAIAGDTAYPVDVLQSLIAVAPRGVYAFCRWDNLADLPAPKSVIVWGVA